MKGTSGFFLCEFIEKALVDFREGFPSKSALCLCPARKMFVFLRWLHKKPTAVYKVESRTHGVSIKNDENT